MSISVDPLNHIISIPQDYLTLISGTLYELDTNQFRLDLKSWEDSEEGIGQLKTHNHNTTVLISGVTYARAIEILAPYCVCFEDGIYTVLLKGSNNNIADVGNHVLNQNSVQVIPGNSAGLQIVTSGSGVTDQDKTDIITGVWANIERTLTTSGAITSQDIADIVAGVWVADDRTLTESETVTSADIALIVSEIWANPTRTLSSGTMDAVILAISKVTMNKVTKSGDIITIYEDNETDVWKQYNLADSGRVEI